MGRLNFLSPEDVVEIQTIFQSDILMQLDVCTAYGRLGEGSGKSLGPDEALG
jgi:tRNA-guanine family transglycosylase